MATIHWLGAGLSTAPGIRRLTNNGHRLELWNRSLERAQTLVAGVELPPRVHTLDFDALATAVNAGDILVSMLPADMHLSVARLALAQGAHFVSSSYIAADMLSLDASAVAAGLCLVNEVGLDPGIDHLMAHALVNQYREWGGHEDDFKLQFRSYCGGVPKTANDFRYKFSWSPVGVLRALKSPARCIENGEELRIERPWLGIRDYQARLADGVETFQAYPNRDSIPFINQYHFDPDWQLDQFVRGTLRLAGWSEAWSDLFTELESLQGSEGERRLQQLGAELWERYRYDTGEPDRVVLCVELQALQAGHTRWHHSFSIDAIGNERGSAMARLVSCTVSLAVESVLAGEITPGVSAAPSNPGLIAKWLQRLGESGEQIHRRQLV